MTIFQKIIIGFGAICIAALVTFSAHAFGPAWQPQASLEKNGYVKLQDKITIDFSAPVATSTVEKNISIVPEMKVAYAWENGNRKLVISPVNHWASFTDYDVSINNAKSIFYTTFDFRGSFSTLKDPAVESIIPIAGEKNVAVDIEDPVTVRFSQPLGDYSVKFVVVPDQNLSYEMSADKKTIKLLASDDFKYATNYDIKVFLKYKSDDGGAFQKVGETNFTTAAPLPPPPPPNAQWPANFNDRVAQAKQLTVPQITTGKYIDVNLKQQIMVIFEDGQPLDSYMISSGKPGMPTPTGTFKIENKTPRAWSKEFGLWMPNWMAILPSGKVGIHELPEWPSGYKEGAAHLGTPVSHGCVRLGVGPAKRVYDWADLGTPVIIHF